MPGSDFRALLVAEEKGARHALRRCVGAAFPLAAVDEARTSHEAYGLLCRRDYALLVADEPNADVLDVAAREHPWTARVLLAGKPDHRGIHAVLARDAPLPEAAAALRRVARST